MDSGREKLNTSWQVIEHGWVRVSGKCLNRLFQLEYSCQLQKGCEGGDLTARESEEIKPTRRMKWKSHILLWFNFLLFYPSQAGRVKASLAAGSMFFGHIFNKTNFSNASFKFNVLCSLLGILVLKKEISLIHSMFFVFIITGNTGSPSLLSCLKYKFNLE